MARSVLAWRSLAAVSPGLGGSAAARPRRTRADRRHRRAAAAAAGGERPHRGHHARGDRAPARPQRRGPAARRRRRGRAPARPRRRPGRRRHPRRELRADPGARSTASRSPTPRPGTTISTCRSRSRTSSASRCSRAPASRVWGPNAFGGVVNIVTRRPAGRSLQLEARGRGARLPRGGRPRSRADAGGFAGAAHGLGESFRRLPAQHRLRDRDGQLLRFGPGRRLRACASWPATPARTSAPTASTPTSSRTSARTRRPPSRVSPGILAAARCSLTPKLSWRRHDDHYLLDSDRPAFYENRHRTDVGGLELQATDRHRRGGDGARRRTGRASGSTARTSATTSAGAAGSS